MQGIYLDLWNVLQDSAMLLFFVDGKKEALENYFINPTDHADEILGIVINRTGKSEVLSNMNLMGRIEQSVGGLRRSHRSHFIHSINMFFTGCYLVECHPKLKEVLFSFPGYYRGEREEVDLDDEKFIYSFCLRWFFACLYHDVGYGYQLLAQGLNPDTMGIPWAGTEQSLLHMRRMKHAVQRSIEELVLEWRYLAEIREDETIPDQAVHGGLSVDSDAFKLMAEDLSGFGCDHPSGQYNHRHLPTTGGAPGLTRQYAQQEIERAFRESFVVGDDRSFDHGKISALLMLQEIQAAYMRERQPGKQERDYWNRAAFYREIIDAATAVFLHNTFRFQFFPKEYEPRWKQINPWALSPLGYLLMVCDLLVEWDREQYGFGVSTHDHGNVSAKNIRISCDADEAIHIRFVNEDQFTQAEPKAGKLRAELGPFDQHFLRIDIAP